MVTASGGHPLTPVNLLEYQEAARAILPRSSYDYIAGGSGDEVTLRENRQAFGRWRLVPRMIRGLAKVDLGTTLLGQSISMPVLFSPVSFQRLACPEGEMAAAEVARDAGTIFTLSTLATHTMEDVATVAGTWWFQLYCYADREVTLDLVQRAEAAGASAIVITVDMPVVGRREADERNAFVLPEGIEMANLARSVYRRLPEVDGSGFAAYISTLWDPSLSWEDIDWIASKTGLPIGIKGVLAPEDGRIALEHGARLIVVSNHGGRQLDTAVASVDALEGVVQRVEGRCEVLLDGGVRRGTDVVKALALGARAVMIGRPYVFGLAVGGREGASHVLELLRAELAADLLLCGCDGVESVPRSLLKRNGGIRSVDTPPDD